MKTRRVNLYGGPGVGKSTLAARVFGALKAEGREVELVQEFVKTWVYQDRRLHSFDYVFTFGTQLHTEDLFLSRGVEIVVTDSPLLLQSAYAEWEEAPVHTCLREIAFQFEDAFSSRNFFVQREVGFNPHGRWQTSVAEAEEIDHRLTRYLNAWDVPFRVIGPNNLDLILSSLP